MNYSKLFMNAILNLYKCGVYTVDYAILKMTEYSDKNKINATDYESAITYLAEEQSKQMIQIGETTEPIGDNTESVENVENIETTEPVEENPNEEESEENTNAE